MAYKRKYNSKAELSAALSRAARSRKNTHNCGRKRKVDGGKSGFTSLYIAKNDKDVLARIANHSHISMVEFIHMIASKLKSARTDIFGQ